MEFNSFNPKTRAELKEKAKEKLRGNWGSAVLSCLIVLILTSSLSFSQSMRETGYRTSFDIGGLIQIIIGGPLSLGLSSYFLKLLRDEGAEIGDVFSGFKNFTTAFLVQLLSGIFILLWTCLFIIPGIIAAFSYAMDFYILKDNPNLSAMDILRLSKKLMNGDKGRLFVLYLSFIGWILAGIVTLGIGFLWIIPYINATVAAFYEELKERKLSNTNTVNY